MPELGKTVVDKIVTLVLYPAVPSSTIETSIAAPDSSASAGDRLFDIGLVVLYAALIGFLTLQHVMGPDELQQWLIARHSNGLAELYRNRRYEGHPIPWYVLLYPFAHVSSNPEFIKVINLAISIGAAWLAVRHLLRNRAEKILFLLSPTCLYYFAVLDRPYMLGYCLILLACIALRRPQRMLTIFILLGALASLHVYYLLAASALLAYYLLKLGLPRSIRTMPPRFWTGLALCLALFALCIYQVLPPPDMVPFRNGTPKLSFSLAMLALAMGPNLGAETYAMVFVLLLAPLAWLIWIGLNAYKRECFFLLASIVLVLGFQTLVYGGGPWHAGVIYSCILAAVFLMRDQAAARTDRTSLNQAFYAMLILHAASGLWLLLIVTGTLSSNSRNTARFIEQYCHGECTVVSDLDSAGVAVAGYLDQPVYYVNRGRMETFRRLDDAPELPHDIEHVAAAARQYPDPVMITNIAATAAEEQELHLKRLQAYTGALISQERYYIYVFASD